MSQTIRHLLKFTGAVTAAAGIVALSAVVASGAATGAIVSGFKSAKSAMQSILGNSAPAAAEKAGEPAEPEEPAKTIEPEECSPSEASLAEETAE